MSETLLNLNLSRQQAEKEILSELKTDIRKLKKKIELLDLSSKKVSSLKDLEPKDQVIINKCLVDNKQDYFFRVWIKNKYCYYVSIKGLVYGLNKYGIKKAFIRVNYSYSLRTENKGVLENE